MAVALAPRADKEFDVVGLGFNTFDHICVTPGPLRFDGKQRLRTYLRQPGGQVPTALVALQRWGLRTAYIGPLGDDEGGRTQRASLAEEGVDLRGCRLRPGTESQISFVLVDEVSGERSIVWHRPEGLTLPLGDGDLQLAAAGRVLLLDADDMGTAIRAARRAKEEGTLVVVDIDAPGPRIAELFACTDVAIVPRGFALRLAGKDDIRYALRRIQRLGPPLVVATLGAAGARALAAGHSYYVPARRVPAVDTTSAGDLFHAGCIYGILQEWNIQRLLSFAGAAAALECTRLGGRAAIPTLEQVARLTDP